MQCLGQSSVFFSAFWSSDPFGKSIFLALFGLSVLSWFILLYKIALLKSIQKEGQLAQNLIEKQKNNILDITLGSSPSTHAFFKDVYTTLRVKAVETLDKNHHFAAKAHSTFLSKTDLDIIETQGAARILQIKKTLERHVFILSSVVSLAPFLGILGTVWGILISMGEMQKGAAIHSNAVILGGISTALATTVLGLVIAIPALIAHNYIKTTIRHVLCDLQTFTQKVLSLIEIQYRKPL